MAADPPPFGPENLRVAPSGPSVPGGGGGVLRWGFDQVIEKLSVAGAVGAVFPRNVAGDPLRVVLPNVREGNYLRVNWALSTFSNDDPQLIVSALASFDGSTVFPGGFGIIINSTAGGVVDAAGATYSAFSILEIPAGATTATVQLLYVASGAFDVGGIGPEVPLGFPFGCRLEASELDRQIIAPTAYPAAPGWGVLLF